MWRVFTAQYALNPYITQIRVVLKWLNHINMWKAANNCTILHCRSLPRWDSHILTTLRYIYITKRH